MQDINKSRDFDIETLSEYLKMIKNQSKDIRKSIVKEYTDDVLYKYFNKWLNELDFLAYRKISYFVALLMYGINDYKKETDLEKEKIKDSIKKDESSENEDADNSEAIQNYNEVINILGDFEDEE